MERSTRLIDWLLRLPEGLEQEFKQRVIAYERSKSMPYVTSIERLAKTQGEVQGQMRTILRLLGRRCGALTPQAEGRIRTLSLEQLDELGDALLDFRGPTDLDNWLSQH